MVQVYASQVADFRTPVRSLAAFKRIHLEPGQSRVVELYVDEAQLVLTDPAGRQALHPGTLTFSVGGSQPDDRSTAMLGRTPLSASIVIHHGT